MDYLNLLPVPIFDYILYHLNSFNRLNLGLANKNLLYKVFKSSIWFDCDMDLWESINYIYDSDNIRPEYWGNYISNYYIYCYAHIINFTWNKNTAPYLIKLHNIFDFDHIDMLMDIYEYIKDKPYISIVYDYKKYYLELSEKKFIRIGFDNEFIVYYIDQNEIANHKEKKERIIEMLNKYIDVHVINNIFILLQF